MTQNKKGFFCFAIPLISIFFISLFSETNASSKYKSCGLPGEAKGMYFEAFAYSNEKAKEVLAKAEETYQRFLQSLGVSGMMFKDCHIFFWENKEDYLKETKEILKRSGPAHAAAFAVYNFEHGKVAIFAYEEKGIFSDILPHELSHQFLAMGLCPTGIPHIPLWINEGIAQYVEENKKGKLHYMISAVKGNKYFDFKDLTVTYAYRYPEKDVNLFYAQSLSLVEFFLENYPGDKLYSLARRLVNREPIEKALKNTYWLDGIANLEDLGKKWLAWIKK